MKLPVNKPEIINPEKEETSSSLTSMNLVELKEECKKRGFSGYSNLNKTELVELLINK